MNVPEWLYDPSLVLPPLSVLAGVALTSYLGFKREREAHKRQLERDEAAHQRQLERDREERRLAHARDVYQKRQLLYPQIRAITQSLGKTTLDERDLEIVDGLANQELHYYSSPMVRRLTSENIVARRALRTAADGEEADQALLRLMETGNALANAIAEELRQGPESVQPEVSGRSDARHTTGAAEATDAQ